MLFNKSLTTSNVADIHALPELKLHIKFKEFLPEHVVKYLNEPKVMCVTSATVMAKEFAVTHKMHFSSFSVREARSGESNTYVQIPN